MEGTFTPILESIFCTVSMVSFLMKVPVPLHVTSSAFTMVSAPKNLSIFRGTFPLVLHNCHTLKHLYAQVCYVNYILKFLNAQPFS